MIVRITRARILPNADAAVFEILREVSKGVERPSGIKALYFARRMSDTGNYLVSITVWSDLETLQAAMGTSMEVAAFMPQLQPFLTDATVEHFETIAERFEDLADIGI